MGKYKKGTQEQLDAARDDATLLPFETVFITNKNIDSDGNMLNGIKVVRGATAPGEGDCASGKCSVAFAALDFSDYWYVGANDLLPAKKSKPKKWQNGTQAQLDAAKNDARLIPKKTYFLKDMYFYHRVDEKNNSKNSVMMAASGGYCIIESGMFSASDLEPIND